MLKAHKKLQDKFNIKISNVKHTANYCQKCTALMTKDLQIKQNVSYGIYTAETSPTKKKSIMETESVSLPTTPILISLVTNTGVTTTQKERALINHKPRVDIWNWHPRKNDWKPQWLEHLRVFSNFKIVEARRIMEDSRNVYDSFGFLPPVQ